MSSNSPEYWHHKKVLVTGYEGFLGSNLTKRLISLGAKVVGLDIETGRKKTLLSSGDFKKIEVIRGDVANFGLVNDAVSSHKIEVIFHLAAEAIVGKCLKDPLSTFSSNIIGTWNILEASRNSPTVVAIVAASSDKAYGSHEKLPYKEDAPLCGDHPYDVSKSCADLLAYTYYHTFGLPVVVTRCGNIYGPGDFNFSRIIPDAIRCALSNKTLFIRSDGKFTRDYVFVDDIVNGYIFLAEKFQSANLAGEAFNLSAENPYSVLELVNLIYKIAGRKPNYEILNQATYEINHQYLSSEKIRKALKWKPSYTLGEGLGKTIEWYRASLNR